MKALAFVMAGGKGSRLAPLTCHRAKPAVPFGGRYRIIDFVLSNFVNSGYRNIFVLTQYMASSLIQHMNKCWNLSGFGQHIEAVPAQMRLGEHWYRGTADAVYQNLNLVRDARAAHTAVFGGDHIYRFEVSQMQDYHEQLDADLTIATMPVSIQEATRFGVLEVDETGRVLSFQEKPRNPRPIPGQPGMALVSMGNYFFKTSTLEQALIDDARDPDSEHDFGKNVIPQLLTQGASIYAYDFSTNHIPGDSREALPYWKDVGTVDSFYDANMDLRSALPHFNLYNRNWPIRSSQRNYPPAKFVQDGKKNPGQVVDSLICEGTIVCSGSVIDSMLGYDCIIHRNASVEKSVILSGCYIGQGAKVKNVLMDKNCHIDPSVEIGYDIERDAERFPFRTPNGLVVLPKGSRVHNDGPIEIAYDLVEVLRQDPSTSEIMRLHEGKYIESSRNRHSFTAVGD